MTDANLNPEHQCDEHCEHAEHYIPHSSGNLHIYATEYGDDKVFNPLVKQLIDLVCDPEDVCHQNPKALRSSYAIIHLTPKNAYLETAVIAQHLLAFTGQGQSDTLKFGDLIKEQAPLLNPNLTEEEIEASAAAAAIYDHDEGVMPFIPLHFVVGFFGTIIPGFHMRLAAINDYHDPLCDCDADTIIVHHKLVQHYPYWLVPSAGVGFHDAYLNRDHAMAAEILRQSINKLLGAIPTEFTRMMLAGFAQGILEGLSDAERDAASAALREGETLQ